MKKYLQIIAAVAAVMTVSCTKQSETDSASPKGNDVKAYFEASAKGVRAVLDGTDVSWEEGDEIAVFQYGRWVNDEIRNSEKNSFKSDGTSKFTGTIKEYKLRDESKDVAGGKTNSVAERFYAAYPAASCSTCGISTAKYKVTVPASQTGLISDFKKNAIFLGYLNADPGKMGPVTSYDEGTQTLTFLRPFDMFCMTPALKFNVPASLGINKIVVSGLDADGKDVPFAANLGDLRADSEWSIVTTAGKESITNGSPVTVSRSGNSVISGDVYVFIAPGASELIKNEGVFQWTQYSSPAKTIRFDLSTTDGKTATLTLPITGEIKAGTIKNLPAFPTEIAWKLPVGPGIAKIEINKTALNPDDSSMEEYKRILLTAESPSSTIKYGRSTESVPGTADNDYTDTGIERGCPAYLKLTVSTEGYSDYTAHAMLWVLNNKYEFGKTFTDAKGSLNPQPGSVYPETGYLNALKFTYSEIGTSNKIPQINYKGMFLSPSSTSYCSGTLTFVAPESGKARMFFDCLVSKSTSRTISVSIKGVEVAKVTTSKDTEKDFAEVEATGEFDVVAGDEITISINKYVLFHSMCMLWEPTPVSAAASNEQISSKSGYSL